MPIRTPIELFVMLLTDVRQGAEKAEKIYEEVGQVVQDPDSRSQAYFRISEAQSLRAVSHRRVLRLIAAA